MGKGRPRKNTRRARGTGSVRFDARRGVWVGRVPVGKLRGGRTRYREVSDPTQAGCVRKLKAVGPAAADGTLAEWARRWLASLPVRPSTLLSYTGSLTGHVLPALGHLRLSAVTPSRVEQFAAALKAGGLAPNTVLRTLAHLRACLMAAVRDGLIPSNPVSRARKPKRTRPPIDPFTAAELEQVIAAGGVFAALAATGCRIGEACALDAADFDPEKGTLAVTKTLSLGVVGPPKSANGVRTVRVQASALPALAAARGTRRAGPLFRDDAGRRLTTDRVRDQFAALLKRLGLRPRNPHQLRHSVATLAIAAGVPIGNVARDLGDHPDTVVRTYLHPSEGMGIADALDKLFAGP